MLLSWLDRGSRQVPVIFRYPQWRKEEQTQQSRAPFISPSLTLIFKAFPDGTWPAFAFLSPSIYLVLPGNLTFHPPPSFPSPSINQIEFPFKHISNLMSFCSMALHLTLTCVAFWISVLMFPTGFSAEHSAGETLYNVGWTLAWAWSQGLQCFSCRVPQVVE